MNTQNGSGEGSGAMLGYAARVAKIKALPHESLMTAYLMETGWTLHVPCDGTVSPKIIRTVTVGRTTTITMEEISHDVVMDLVRAQLVEEVVQFGGKSRIETVYKWSA